MFSYMLYVCFLDVIIKKVVLKQILIYVLLFSYEAKQQGENF